jgi:DNA-binding response OmpR family regulator
MWHPLVVPGVVQFPRVPRSCIGGTVLLVESDFDTRLLYRAALEPLGAVIVEAEDGADALDKAIRHPPAVIVTETRLPGLDGIALCAALRRELRAAHVHIVVASASASSAVRNEALAAGADEVFLKPFAIDDLIASVRRVLRRSARPATRPDSVRYADGAELRATSQQLIQRAIQLRTACERLHERSAALLRESSSLRLHRRP